MGTCNAKDLLVEEPSDSRRNSAVSETEQQQSGVGVDHMPTNLPSKELADFYSILEQGGIDTSTWNRGNGTKSVEHLFWETRIQRICVLTGTGNRGALKRVVRLTKIRLIAEMFGGRYALFSRLQIGYDGQNHQRLQVPVGKLRWQHFGKEASIVEALCYAEDCPYTEDWRLGVIKTIEERLGLDAAWQKLHLEEDRERYSYRIEDNCPSPGYPGLNTLYCIHEATLRVVDAEDPGVRLIGLPQGWEFATKEGNFNFTGAHDEVGMPFAAQLNIWMWHREEEVRSSRCTLTLKVERNKRVPLPSTRCVAIVQAQGRRTEIPSPNLPLTLALRGQRTEWSMVRRMAERIADPKYTLHEFNDDLEAFPELSLYLLEASTRVQSGMEVTASSGRSVGDEYQRTVGAFFAIFWLLRIHLDGKEGFAFGVDNEWLPLKAPQPGDAVDKRAAFHQKCDWEYFTQVLVDSGLITKSRTSWTVNVERVTSLLVLTAIHDIMKMEVLLPKVQDEHAPYHGYSAGTVIGDHDHALSYLMDHYPHLLPSFDGLGDGEKRSLRFTQCELSFNKGWFVQAEAPPGAVFTKFREILIGDQKAKGCDRDIAFYLIHWLTDLAGAEPTPLGGGEKFVVMFPLPVLNSFLRSFEFVKSVATETETEIMERYLKVRWREHEPTPGPLPTGDSAVAKMRLLCMAQMNAAAVLSDFGKLSSRDSGMLSVEMSRTGCSGQSFSPDLTPREVQHRMGPAFLVYYGPAFLQSLGADQAVKKLSVLGEVYRCARELWPASEDQAAHNVTIRIDAIKSLSIQEILAPTQKGDRWEMVKRNELEAFIELSSKTNSDTPPTSASTLPTQVLDLDCMQIYG